MPHPACAFAPFGGRNGVLRLGARPSGARPGRYHLRKQQSGDPKMRKALRAAAAALLAVAGASAIASVAPSAALAARTDCQPQALSNLQQLSPQGYRIYQDISDKRHFLRFLTCDDVVLGLATAVHESVHLITSDKDA